MPKGAKTTWSNMGGEGAKGVGEIPIAPTWEEQLPGHYGPRNRHYLCPGVAHNKDGQLLRFRLLPSRQRASDFGRQTGVTNLKVGFARAEQRVAPDCSITVFDFKPPEMPNKIKHYMYTV